MVLSLDPQLQAFVDEQVKAGRFQSAQEVINAAVASLQTEQALEIRFSGDDVEDLKKDITVGIQQAERGELVDWNPDEIMAEAERRFREEKRRKH